MSSKMDSIRALREVVTKKRPSTPKRALAVRPRFISREEVEEEQVEDDLDEYDDVVEDVQGSLLRRRAWSQPEDDQDEVLSELEDLERMFEEFEQEERRPPPEEIEEEEQLENEDKGPTLPSVFTEVAQEIRQEMGLRGQISGGRMPFHGMIPADQLGAEPEPFSMALEDITPEKVLEQPSRVSEETSFLQRMAPEMMGGKGPGGFQDPKVAPTNDFWTAMIGEAAKEVQVVDVEEAAAQERVLSKIKEKKVLEEAGVAGGDYGRWGPATSAVGKAGAALAKAISASTGQAYKMTSDGTPQSAEGGSELWFPISPSDQKADIFYLGVKLKGNKESPKWDVILKKGKGLGSATSVGSQRGVESSALGGAISSMKKGFSGSSDKKGAGNE